MIEENRIVVERILALKESLLDLKNDLKEAMIDIRREMSDIQQGTLSREKAITDLYGKINVFDQLFKAHCEEHKKAEERSKWTIGIMVTLISLVVSVAVKYL